MAAHPIASLTISFGLVSIPVKMYASAQPSAEIHFNMLHAKDGSRLRQQYVCIEEGVVVPRDEMVKGYEFAKGQYVTFTQDELKTLEEADSGAAEIVEFLPLEAIDPVYYEKSFYLSPDRGGAKPYALLREALLRTGRTAVGRYAARGKQYIVLIRPLHDGLAMQQLYYPDEVRSLRDLEVPDIDVGDEELALARALVEQLSSEAFHPEQYQDTVRERVQAAIQRKIAGQEVTVTEKPVQRGGKVIDLMEALRASLRRPPERAAAEPKRRAAKRAAAPGTPSAPEVEGRRKRAQR